jgi:hypothetical protein
MKTVAVLFAILILSGCNGRYLPNPVELCILGFKTAQCNDQRRPDEAQDYDRPVDLMTNYICTNPTDYGSMESYARDLRDRLLKTENQLAACRQNQR